MSIRRYRSDLPHWFNDDFAWVDDWLNPFRASFTVRGQFVDPEKYDITPKLEFRQKLIEAKQKEIDDIDKEKKRLEEELNKLKNS